MVRQKFSTKFQLVIHLWNLEETIRFKDDRKRTGSGSSIRLPEPLFLLRLSICEEDDHSSFGVSCLLRWALDETTLAATAPAKSVRFHSFSGNDKQLVFIKWMSNFYLFIFLHRVSCIQGWPWTCHIVEDYFELLILSPPPKDCMHPPMPIFCSAGDQTLGFENVRKGP